MALALDGIRVIELAQLAAAPMAGRHLADLGADVIHIEHPTRGDTWRSIMAPQDESINWNWENYSRNKKSVTLDVFKPGGGEILVRLIEKADAFLTNMRPRELEKAGLEYEALSAVNPRLIYASLTGFGNHGADSNEPGYDHTAYWARSGIAHMVMPDGIPPDCRVGAFGDNFGGMALAFGIVTALFAREKTGVGQEVDVSLFNLGVYQLSFAVAQTLMTGQQQIRVGRKDMPNALMNTFQTKDGRWLLLSILQPDRYWASLCRALGREDLEHDPRFESFMPRLENHAALLDVLEEVFRIRTLEEWKVRLTGIPFSPVQNLAEVVADPQASANEFFVPFDHPTHGKVEMVASPIKLSRTPATIRKRAPEFGEHTEEVLLELGYGWDDIARFKQQGVIA
jgi:crotonobetainyl-CoA:carnitine CoA-transferase CaiB-like acyl-CoA transferase